jgi:RNA polymerase sigma-70 factor (ECF subfamily)
MALAELFLAHGGGKWAARPGAADLESRLAGFIAAARAAWPDVEVPPEVFLRHLAERLPPEGDPDEALGAVHAADLYLAIACARGDERALQTFETQYLVPAAAYVSRSDALPGFADELKQTLRARLLVGREGLLPKIAGYTGQGSLGAWLSITATRTAIDLREAARSHLPVGDDLPPSVAALSFGATPSDPELAYLKSRYAGEFEAALRNTLQTLSQRERNILRLYYQDAMSSEAIGRLYRVTPRTMQRWLARIRSRILRATHELLAQRLDLSATQVDGLMLLVQSQFDLSLFQRPERKKQ